MNRLYMKSIIWSLLGFLLLVSSCKDEDMGVAYDDGRYREVVLPLSYKVSTSVETRALPTSTFEKSCIYQFNSNGELVTKVDLASTDTKVALYVPYSDNVTLQCVFIANASIAEVEANGGEVTDLESLLAKHLVINTNYNPGSDEKVLMSGVATVYNATKQLTFTLKPNVAKFNLTIKPYNKDNYNKLFSVQMRNVHNKIHFAHHAFTDEQKQDIHAKYAHISGTPVEGYGQDLVKYESIALPGANQYDQYPVSYSWYVPHNWLGDKEPYVEDNQHTLFVISYERHGDWKTIKIPIYLAQREDKNNDGKIYEDEVVSYNVEAGVVYNVTVDLQKFIEITEEKKTVNLEKYVEFPANTNCHLLNPSTTGVGTVYSIPVSRAWEYWGTRLPAETKWQAEIIWQDIDEPVLTFCDPDGVVSGGTQQTTYTGQGKDETQPKQSRFYLKLTKNRAGNAVVGVKALDGPFKNEYIWSWHLWITDYNPNVAPTPSAVYPNNVFLVTGGEVHRYKDPFDNSGKTVKQVFWSDPVNKDVVIMDRNLGAYSADPKDNTANNVFRNAGMYYQYGRKDPFPASHTYDISSASVAEQREGADATHSLVTNLYDIYGNLKPKFTYSGGTIDRTDCVAHYANNQFANDQAAFDYSIQHPDVFITAAVAGSADWVPSSSYYVSNWNHQDKSKRDMYAKSIFDPCPLGWRVHRMGAMMIFSNDFRNKEMLNSIYVTGDFNINTIAVTDRYFYHRTLSDNDNDPNTLNKTNFNIASEEFIGSGDNKIFNGYKFYFADYGKGPTTYYPRTNHRLTINGFLVGTEDVCNWSIDGGLGDTDPRHVDYIHYGYHLDFYSTAHGSYMDMPDSAGKAYGLAVRCIKENAQESQ